MSTRDIYFMNREQFDVLKQHSVPMKIKAKVFKNLIPVEETQLIIWFNDVGMPLSTSMLRSYVYQFCQKNAIHTSFSADKGMAGKDWLKGFLNRNPQVAQRHAQHMNPARAQKLNRFVVTDYFEKLEKVLSEMELFDKPDRIFNIDEKGCQLAARHQQMVLAKTGRKRIHLVAPEHGENVTIVTCGNALGNVIPPMIIFKGKRHNDGLASASQNHLVL